MSSVEEMHAPQEDDRLASKVIAIVGAVTLVVILVDLWIAFAMLPDEPLGLEPRAMPSERFGFDPSPIESYERAEQYFQSERELLESYEYVDGQQRIPLDRAMQLYLQRREAR